MEPEKLVFDEAAMLALGREAGRLARDWFGRVTPERKKDSTFVTEADRAVEALVRERLAALTPDWPILGEEGGLSGAGRAGAPTWVLDPLDGTSAFAGGLPVWAVSLGLVRHGQALWGMVFCPLADQLFHANLDGRAYLNGRPFEPEPAAPLDGESILYVPTDVHRSFRIDFPGKVRSLGSAAYHGVLTGRAGTAGVLMRGVCLWDVAGALALNRAWGMCVAYLDGTEVNAGSWEGANRNNRPVLFCRPGNFAYLAERIRYTGK